MPAVPSTPPAPAELWVSEQESSLAEQFYGSAGYQAPASQPAYASHQVAPSSQASAYNLYPAQGASSQAPYGGYAPQTSYQQPQAQAPAQQQQAYSQYSQQPAQNSHYAMPAATAEPAAAAAPSGPEPSQVGNSLC